MKRYAQGKTLKRAISHVILFEAYGSGGPISTPSSGQPDTSSASTGGPVARVKDSVVWGLNIRSSVDISSTANVVATVPAGTQLTLLELDGPSRIGAINQWVRVRTPQGQEGFAAAWYLENVQGAETPPAPVPMTEPAPGSVSEPPVSTPETPATPGIPSEPGTPSTPVESPKEDKLIVVVSSAVGTSGLRLRKIASKGGALLTVLKAGTRLTVLEPTKKAKAKIGKVNQWLYVRTPDNQRGYVGAEYVALP